MLALSYLIFQSTTVSLQEADKEKIRAPQNNPAVTRCAFRPATAAQGLSALLYAMATSVVLPPEIWSQIVGLLSFRDASRGRLICKAFNEAVDKLQHLDLSECKSLLKARLMLCKASAVKALRGRLAVTVPMVRFLEDFQVLTRFCSRHMTGSEIPFETMLTQIPSNSRPFDGLSHLTITNAAFVKYVERPNSTCEYYFTFDASALRYAFSLQSFHAHFDRIVSHISRYDCCCGAWLSGLEYCNARDVRIVVESPIFKSILDDGPSYGAGGGLGDRMGLVARVPSKVHHLYILTDGVLMLERPIGDTYSPETYPGQDIYEEPQVIFNMCLLSVKRPSLAVPNTQIRRIHPSALASFQKPLICVTSRSTPDHVYADNLSRLAPGHCDLHLADDIPSDSWDDQ